MMVKLDDFLIYRLTIAAQFVHDLTGLSLRSMQRFVLVLSALLYAASFYFGDHSWVDYVAVVNLMILIACNETIRLSETHQAVWNRCHPFSRFTRIFMLLLVLPGLILLPLAGLHWVQVANCVLLLWQYLICVDIEHHGRRIRFVKLEFARALG